MKIWSYLALIFLLGANDLMAAKILVARFQSQDMDLVKSVIEQDLKKHSIIDLILTKDSEYNEFIDAVKKNKPDFVALLDNKAVNFMKKFGESDDAALKKLPAGATMALNIRQVLKEHKNICGIVYEVPAFTVVTRFRNVSARPIKTILAPYRKSEFENMFQEARNQLQKENIELLGVNVEENGKEAAAINRLVESVLQDSYNGKKLDAILIPADNLILNKEAFVSIWLPKSRQLKLPFLCNIEKFTSKDFDFCSFAAYPDLTDLGHQFSEQIAEIVENGGSPEELGIDYIVAAKQVMNLSKIKAIDWPLKEDKATETP